MRNRKAIHGITQDNVALYEKVVGQLTIAYKEIGDLSKKKPNDAINTFKLEFINQTLILANGLLGDAYRPFPHFQTFDTATLPTTSDVVLVLSHYRHAMTKFHHDHTDKDLLDTDWNFSDDDSGDEPLKEEA